MYFIIPPPLPNTNHNSPINSFCPLDTALILTSDNFQSIFAFITSIPPFFLFLSSGSSGSYLKLSHDAIFTVYSHTFILF